MVSGGLGPAGSGSSDLRILNIRIGATADQPIYHRLVTIERGVVKAGAGVIKPAGNGIDPGALAKDLGVLIGRAVGSNQERKRS